jgi:hypothetical protein
VRLEYPVLIRGKEYSHFAARRSSVRVPLSDTIKIRLVLVFRSVET